VVGAAGQAEPRPGARRLPSLDDDLGRKPVDAEVFAVKIDYLAGGDAVTEQMQRRLVATLYAQPVSLLLGAASMILVGTLAWLRTRMPWLLGWSALSFVVLLARVFLAHRFHRIADAADPELWARRFTYGAWSVGALWGAISLIVVTTDDAFTLFLAITVQAGYIAGGAARNTRLPLLRMDRCI
jgi:hypothetical protein